MAFQDLFKTKSLEMLHEEMKGENRLRRVLGPVGLTSLGVGAIIGAGIFVITGRVASNDAGPGVLVSYAVAGLACALAAFCYAEFASMAPVAGSAYTYAYATLGEIFAWIIGWDLILEYAMSAATVAAVWTKYLNKLLHVLRLPEVPEYLSNDPFSTPGAWCNLPAVLILFLCTVILVIGIRESAASNTALVCLKLGVVLFVIIVGIGYVSTANWFDIPVEGRKTPEQIAMSEIAGEHAKIEVELRHAAKEWASQFGSKAASVTVTNQDGTNRTLTLPRDKKDTPTLEERSDTIKKQSLAVLFAELAAKYPDSTFLAKVNAKHAADMPTKESDLQIANAVLARAREKAPGLVNEKWGMVGQFGINKTLEQVDDAARSTFMPYGISGVMVGAALVFFAFIGFDSISTHSEEAINPQRDVPIGIIASLGLCTLLYIAMAAVITGMVPYPEIDVNAAVASAFTDRAQQDQSPILNAAGGLIAAGALAGMTSVLLITFLSQARIFLAMARDGLMPQSVFGAVHEKFRTPHISTMLTGALMMCVAAFTPILKLEEMVNIGTLFAFVVVCSAVLILRIKRPDAHRPFKTPFLYFIAPAGILVNAVLMFFLAPDTWARLVIWLVIGLCIYFGFGIRHSILRKRNSVLGQKSFSEAEKQSVREGLPG
jgi:APA family basic amino acid/polyamine antiporter